MSEELTTNKQEPKRNYWLHRITGGNNGAILSYPLLKEHSIISTGWSDFSTNQFVEETKQKGITHIENCMKNKWSISSLPKNRWSLYNFICKFQKGDIVVVPMWGGKFSICQITNDEVLTNESIPAEHYTHLGISRHEDGYLYKDDEKKCIDLGFYRNVKILHKEISRADYADQKLFSRMKIMQTNANIFNIHKNVDDAIRRADNEAPICIYKELLDASLSVVKRTITDYTQHLKYEKLVEKYLWAIGANDVQKPPTNESKREKGDADRVAYFEDLKVAVMVQVKKHHEKTDDWSVEQIIRYNENHQNDDYNVQLWVISNANDFEEDAKQKAFVNNVRLINGNDFARMILEVGLKHFE